MADIAPRLTADANYASQYRLRLIAADMIHSAGHGHVDYTLPYRRDHLREQPRQHRTLITYRHHVPRHRHVESVQSSGSQVV